MNTYWINNSPLEEYNKVLTQKKSQIFEIKDKNKISRMKNGDKIVYFLNDKDLFIGISEVKSDNYEVINNNLSDSSSEDEKISLNEKNEDQSDEQSDSYTQTIGSDGKPTRRKRNAKSTISIITK